LGAGGMGEVWRARDERLGRDVAIKVLPADLASDPERLRRFVKEARATGALNHPGKPTSWFLGMRINQLFGESYRPCLKSSAGLCCSWK